MRALVLVLVAALAAGTACGKYGPPVRASDEKPASAKPAFAKPDTGKSQDPNSPAQTPAPAPAPAPAPGATP